MACTGLLPARPDNSVVPSGGCRGTASYSKCSTTCAVGYTGAPSVECIDGTWADWEGECSPGAAAGRARLLFLGC